MNLWELSELEQQFFWKNVRAEWEKYLDYLEKKKIEKKEK